jgi:hypothetical protein
MASFTGSDFLSADMHIFSPKLWPSGAGPGTYTRQWHFSSGEARVEEIHKICLRHCQVSGNWVLICDGRYVTSGMEPVLTRHFTIPFEFGGKTVNIYGDGTDWLTFEHTLVMDGRTIKELSQSIVDARLVEDVVPRSVTVPKYRTYAEMGKQVVVYIIEVTAADGETRTLERRNSDFNYLDAAIRSATDGHMASSLPNLPGKCYNPWTDQTSPEFIHERRCAVELYMQQVLSNSKVATYTDLLVFLGLHPLTGRLDPTPCALWVYPPSNGPGDVKDSSLVK